MSTSDPNTLVGLARSREATIATAESLTGGAVCVALAEVPGVSDVLRGGVVAYEAEVKQRVLGVDGAVLDKYGPVSEQVAREMAAGVRAAMGARIGLATTGAAGPEPHGGQPPGTVWIAVDYDGHVTTKKLEIDGDRSEVTTGAVAAVLECCVDVLKQDTTQA